MRDLKTKRLRNAILALVVLFAASCVSAQAPPDGIAAAQSQPIPRWSKIYIAPMPDSFDRYLKRAIQEKNVPVVPVSERREADFEITGSARSKKANAAKILILGSWHSSESATIRVVRLRDQAVVFRYSYHNWNSAHGRQSSAEACAKHLKEKIEGGR